MIILVRKMSIKSWVPRIFGTDYLPFGSHLLSCSIKKKRVVGDLLDHDTKHVSSCS